MKQFIITALFVIVTGMAFSQSKDKTTAAAKDQPLVKVETPTYTIDENLLGELVQMLNNGKAIAPALGKQPTQAQITSAYIVLSDADRLINQLVAMYQAKHPAPAPPAAKPPKDEKH